MVSRVTLDLSGLSVLYHVLSFKQVVYSLLYNLFSHLILKCRDEEIYKDRVYGNLNSVAQISSLCLNRLLESLYDGLVCVPCVSLVDSQLAPRASLLGGLWKSHFTYDVGCCSKCWASRQILLQEVIVSVTDRVRKKLSLCVVFLLLLLLLS